MSVEYTNIEQAIDVLDSVCASPALPDSLYNWQKDAWVYIRAYIMESQKTSANTQSKPCSGWAKGDGCGSGGRCGDEPCLV